MSDKNIQLPNFLIAELYKTSIVHVNSTIDLKSVNPTPETNNTAIINLASEKKIEFLGDNKKGVVILVSEPKAAFLLEDDFNFLTNILKACQLDISDIAIVNIFRQPVTYAIIKEELKCAQLVLFDVEPSLVKLPFLIPAFQLQNFDNCAIMFAPALEQLNKPTHDGKVLKTKLWMSLKQVFKIV